jgi:succinate dehydrogenase / fumarate reductase cytochrome b subunit
LNLFTIHFPVTAWVSIAHRLSGVFIFLLIPFLLWTLQESLISETHFRDLGVVLTRPIMQVGLWFFLSALLYHGLAGVRHLFMDVHIGETKATGRLGAWLVIIVFLPCVGVLGYWLW